MIINNALIPPTAPAGLCNLTLQEQINILWAATQLDLDSLNNLLIQADEPGVDQRSYAWYRLTGAELYPDLIYKYANGAWLAKHPVPASGSARQLWVGTELALVTYDGGAAGVVGPYSGPMWEIDEDFEGRIPMGPGEIVGTDPLKTLAVGEDYGDGGHTITQAELPDVDFDLNVNDLSQAPGGGAQAGLLYQEPGTGSGNVANPPQLTVNSGGDGDAFNIVPPVRGAYIIKRTARQFYKAI